MEIRGRVIVVTGAARGIGAAICRRAVQERAEAVVVSDRDPDAAERLAEEIGCTAIPCDVAVESEVQSLVSDTIKRFGRIDIFISNAGITARGGLECSNADWQRLWDVNVMSRMYAARAVIPQMLERGEGYLIHTASAAGLLTEIGSAGYSVTKHADLSMAEWLSVCYGRHGIRVSCICPLGVATDMLDDTDPIHRYLHLHCITPDDVAEAVVRGIETEEFLILPHPEVREFFQLKAEDRDRWLRGMQRLREKLTRSASRQSKKAG